ncbi:DUF4286 family protein [Flavobacteriaceae bacterium]|jgi:hypothetical protein|nr:DUF4286 family protein [Flavobacteriaceae bacterium]MDC1539734.1 DUF4286 family protein [Flavobacteriaceae bacterium]
MIIYNITANIDDSIHDDWLEWIQQHIPKVLATGFFIKATFTKVLVEESMGGLTYSIQYLAPSKAALEAYYQQHAAHFQAEETQRFADKMLAFRTELEWIDEFTLTPH